VCAREPGQIDERFDTRMMAIDDRRVQQLSGSITSAVQQLVECCCGDRVGGQARVRLTDRAVGLSSVMPNETFSRRHDVLPSSSELDLQMSTAQKCTIDVDAERMDHAQPDAASSAMQSQN
jgi:hypothetical protein